MKKIFIYFATAMMLASCSSEDNVVEEVDKPYNPFPDYNGVVATMPDVESEGDEDPVTRSSLTYNLDLKNMKFSWTADDAIGVFAITHNGEEISNENTSQQKWIIDSGSIKTGENTSSGIFYKSDNAVATLEAGAKYVAYTPYVQEKSEYNCDNIHVTYRGQTQAVNVNTSAYYKRAQSKEMMNAYLESEPLASAHLCDFDYNVSEAIGTPTGGAHFAFTRLGSVARFFFKAPARDVFDALVFYNADANFILDAIMDVKSKKLTSTQTGHGLTLKLGVNGFDLTSESASPNSFNNGNGYIIAYLMSAPMTNLKELGACTLYLLGHKDITVSDWLSLTEAEKKAYEKVGDKYRIKTYYKNSAELSKYNLEQNKVQRWTPTLGPDDQPIEFQSISVQQWKEETGYGNDGKGTETW